MEESGVPVWDKKKQVSWKIDSVKWKQSFCIWMILVVVLSVLAQAAGPKYVAHFFLSTEAWSGQTTQQSTAVQLAPVAALQNTEHYTTRETSGQKTTEFLEGQTFRRLRYAQQHRQWANLAANVFSVSPDLLKQYFSLGYKEQKELLSRSRLIVEFICRADGKKDGILSLIK